MKICESCGKEFRELTKIQKFCSDCNYELYRSVKFEDKHNEVKRPRKNNPNQKLIDEVKEATKLNLSYGVYKGRKV